MPRQQETSQPLVRLRQRQEGIAHGRRTEPLVPHQLVSLARTAGAHGIGLGGVGPDVGTALLLGHGHTDGNPGLVGHADVARIVFRGEDLWQPLLCQVRLQAHRRNTGECHGQRAAAAGLGLTVQVRHGGAGDMGTVLRMSPGQRSQAMADRRAHQLVIGRMKLHQVDAMTVAVMAAEHRFVLVGQKASFHQWSAGQRSVCVNPRFGPTGPKAPRPFLKRQVDAVQVGAVQRGRLVGDFVGFGELMQVHDGAPLVSQGISVKHRPLAEQSVISA
ncbi:hypothetical protein D3C76_658110 [compost metagenome]